MIGKSKIGALTNDSQTGFVSNTKNDGVYDMSMTMAVTIRVKMVVILTLTTLAMIWQDMMCFFYNETWIWTSVFVTKLTNMQVASLFDKAKQQSMLQDWTGQGWRGWNEYSYSYEFIWVSSCPPIWQYSHWNTQLYISTGGWTTSLQKIISAGFSLCPAFMFSSKGTIVGPNWVPQKLFQHSAICVLFGYQDSDKYW